MYIGHVPNLNITLKRKSGKGQHFIWHLKCEIHFGHIEDVSVYMYLPK